MVAEQTNLETQVAVLRKDVENMKEIHVRLDNAIHSISDVTSAINRMLAVHEEKISQQEEAVFVSEQLMEKRRVEFSKDITEIHSRISKVKEELSKEMTEQHYKNERLLESIKTDVIEKVNDLERWRWIIFGGISVLAVCSSIILPNLLV